MTTKTQQTYDATDIEVLTGLEPVRRRPGMYTETNRPDHLAQEVIDNSVDEAVAGHARRIEVTLHADGSLEVSDDGRGMPVDTHPTEGVPAVEVILGRLHAGGKFSSKSYRYSGGLHGVGVSVVNALSTRLQVHIRRDGAEHTIAFSAGERIEPLEQVGKTRETGTTLRFWPDTSYFDSPRFSRARLEHLLRAKAVLCPGLTVVLRDATGREGQEPEVLSWYYEDGLRDYLAGAVAEYEHLPDPPFTARLGSEHEEMECALVWLPEGSGPAESYVNLIPTAQGGTHVNGLRTGLTEALREFCELRNLLPRGVRIAPEDVWEHISYVLSVKMHEPQFAGQTKERLSSRNCAAFVSGAIKDAFSLWLNEHTQSAEQIVDLVVRAAQRRQRAAKKVTRKRVGSGPALPGKLADCTGQDPARSELFLVEGDSAGGSAKQAREREFQAVMPLRGKILNTWEVAPDEVMASQEVHDIAVALGVDPGSDDLSGLRYHKVCVLADADPDGAHIATLLCALFQRHFPALVAGGHVYVAMPPLYRIDVGKQTFYALDRDERQGILDRIEAERIKGKVQETRFKGLGEMNPVQLRETTMAPDTRRLVQLTVDDPEETERLLGMLLGRGAAAQRREWLESKGNLAEIVI
ncbi:MULTISPECIES: DNA topoisomerase IV subunit B [Halorhodospira]|uniref:DNA topoisomerase IV subunit B n=1 Tax=Halorhodospira TaxID=85108 RepID=UPI001EE8F0B2|nr:MULTISPECIES: DNA topoisomerase IV subunit B [Halorhodospira]MCG5527585.1 DNA topoisomerase IV subunit B [Halorhodospira halophila]MCG5544412.1 DNA topoisomerase IV subunit B [Halorhodospira sp. 9628]